jgi:hypothetical protein
MQVGFRHWSSRLPFYYGWLIVGIAFVTMAMYRPKWRMPKLSAFRAGRPDKASRHAFLPTHMLRITAVQRVPWVTARSHDQPPLQVSGLGGRSAVGVRGVERPN